MIPLNCTTADYAFPAVAPSEIAGGQSSTRHLISHGHRRIATVTGEPWMQAAQDWLKGYRRALATADIPFDPELVVEGDWSAGYAATVKLLALKDRPTAIFRQNDRTAIGCYEALKEACTSRRTSPWSATTTRKSPGICSRRLDPAAHGDGPMGDRAVGGAGGAWTGTLSDYQAGVPAGGAREREGGGGSMRGATTN